MNPAVLAELETILRAGSKTFHLASRALPSRVRPATLALYAFCRKADDAVDDAGSARGASAAVDRLAERIDRVYAGRGLDDVVTRAFAEVASEFAIPRALPTALCDGMRWDAQGKVYDGIDDVRAYGARVAGTVGVMMTYLMGPRDRDVLARACDLGVAMQLTNIARDVGEDARNGRVYLPATWLREAGVDRDELVRRAAPTDGVRAVTRRLLEEADLLYRRADEGVAHLPRDCRVAIRAARLVYAEIGRVIEARGHDSVTGRAVVPLWRKLWLLGRAFGARRWPAAPLAPRASPELDGILPAASGGGA